MRGTLDVSVSVLYRGPIIPTVYQVKLYPYLLRNRCVFLVFSLQGLILYCLSY